LQVEMQQALTGDKTPKQALDDAATAVAESQES
jgi:ABC-type glycerol-3-phosphate transport system substrate-binding protein